MRHAPAATRPGALVEEATALLAAPGLVVVAGGPGSGRSTVLTQLGAAFRGPVFAGGGLAMLQAVPAFALTRAVRVRLPAADPALLAEAVRSRVRGGLLILDDLQWADPATLSALPRLAAHCRMVVALRTPHRLPPDAVPALRAAAAGWLTVPPLDAQAATELAHRVAPGLDPVAVAAVVGRAGGVPLAVETLARHAAAHGSPGAGAVWTEERSDEGRRRLPGPGGRASGASASRQGADLTGEAAQVEYAVAAALADLTRPARTAMAALGLLGRPATAAVLGAGVDELAEAGLVTHHEGELAPVSPYLAEVAAGLLDPPGRAALHRRLAGLVPPREAARHLAAAGDGAAAYRVAVAAADRMPTAGERAELLLLACDLPEVDAEPAVRVAAAGAALTCGRPRAAVRVLSTAAPLGVDAAVLRGEALLQVGDVAAARAAVAPVPDDAAPAVVATRDRILLLARLAADPAGAPAAAARVAARHGDPPRTPGCAPRWPRYAPPPASRAGSTGWRPRPPPPGPPVTCWPPGGARGCWWRR
ncbi:ATP-binding protein [Phytohabitans rumicis]|uniref:ATP-binding protein n=1 Tax=Phytohabitans rumicis TaxID=1076125 RepID=UPI001FE9BE6D|nr:ATP-binding protein [Phytohabitans rumicis]